MWIPRTLDPMRVASEAQPVKVLKGPRQVGKTALLERLSDFKAIYFDDLATRELATRDPRFFLDHIPSPLLLDEATLVPVLFVELKRRVDEARRLQTPPPNVWVTGSNQTLLHQNVRESLAGRTSYFDLNTLSVEELHRAGCFELRRHFLRGGWPELYRLPQLDPVRYLNDLLSTFVERDIVMAAGIERREGFSLVLRLVAGRTGQLMNASDIARNAGVDVATVQSWCRTLEDNGILRRVAPWYENRSQRLIKTPKFFVEDVGLAVRLQGWTSFDPLFVSPAFGSLFETAVHGEITRFFTSRGKQPEVNFLRTKDGVEVDFLVHLGNQQAVAIEVKATPTPMTSKQHELLDQLSVSVRERWIVCQGKPPRLPADRQYVELTQLASRLAEL